MQRLWRHLLVTAGVAVGVAWPIERAAAQQYLGSLTYNLGIPTGDTQDFTDNESWLGFTFEGQWLVRPNVSAGLLLGWNEFYHRTDTTLPLENGAISGGQYRHLNIFPMLVGGKYYINGGASIGTTIAPYVGVSAGTYYVRQLFDIGTVEFTDTGWLFGVAPELGILVPVRAGSVAVLNARYNLPFSSGSFLGDESQSFQYWTISVGVGFGI
ncbi:MAG TPA: hypothetical protein VHQ45_10030 [Gemmatimonadaceae bacterium]|jgi:hypothetical protein|nr:hypothetical protein [Gemmatimonadaceae bacterium]